MCPPTTAAGRSGTGTIGRAPPYPHEHIGRAAVGVQGWEGSGLGGALPLVLPQCGGE
jgi:hypothetical protein